LIFDVNPTAAKLIGLNRSKIIGTICHQFICPVEAGKCPITDLEQKIDDSERILLKADGSRLPVLKTVIPIPIDGHDYLLESFIDISERKFIESELQESEAKFRDLAERALVGIYLFQDGIFRYVNPKFADIQGYSVDEIIDVLGPKNLVHPDDWPSAEKNIMERLSETSQSIDYEVRIVTKTGEVRSVELTGSRTIYQGRPAIIGTIMDVTDRKRVEEDLQEAKLVAEASRAQFEQVVSMISDVVWRYDVNAEGENVGSYISPVAEKMLGLPDGTIGNSSDKYFSYIHVDDLQVMQEVLSGAVRTLAKDLTTEYRMQRADGTTLWVRSRGSAYSQPDGRITVFGTTIDITDRKRAEEELQESEQRLSEIIDFLPDATFAVDKSGLVIAWNRAIEEMTGVDRSDMVGQGDHAYTVPFYGVRRPQLLDLLDEDDNEIASNYQYVQRIGNSLYAETFTPALRQGKGAYVWATAGPIFDIMGDRIGAIESIRDITERKYEQDELKSNLRFLETLIETIPSPIFFIDRQGRYLGCNDSFAQQIIGMPKANIIGKSVYELPEAIPPDLADKYHEQDQKLFRETGTQDYEMQVQCSDGEMRDFFFTKATFKNYTGEVAGIVGVMLDITKRKQAELSIESSIIRQKRLNQLQLSLLAPAKLEQKLKMITDGVVDIFGADFCRIWITSSGDLCEAGCKHAEVTEGPHICRSRDRCLRLLASSGRYTHTDGDDQGHVLFGCYKIGLVVSGEEEHKFLTNDVQNDPRVHNHEWAEEIGLVSFAGYQLRPPGGDTSGVLALFSKQNITSEDDAQLDNLSNMTALIIQADRIDEDLRASNRIIEGIINAIPLRVFWKDKNLVFLGCNATFAHDAGFADSKDIIGKNDYQMGWHDQADLYRSDDRQVIESGRSKIFVEETQTTPAGNSVVLLTSKVPLRSSEGEIVGIIGTYMDITERKQAEDALQEAKLAADESRSQYEQVVSMISDVVWSYDVNAMGQYIGSYISPVADRMLGVPDGTIGNRFDKFFSYVLPDDLPAVLQTLSEVIRTLVKDVNVEYRLLRADGATIWVRSRASAYAQPNGRVTAFGTTSDYHRA
jgi:PAS domain S-box-containing protein